jgi:hypothetical protein
VPASPVSSNGGTQGEQLTRNKLASLGLAAVLSYGFVSNINAITLVRRPCALKHHSFAVLSN